MSTTESHPESTFHLFLDPAEAEVAVVALNLLIADEAHQTQIRQLAREVLAGLHAAEPGETGTLTLTLGPEEMKITHTAVRVLLDDTQREQADEREVLRSILEKLPDEHTMRAIRLK
jgi:hypothetical protein